ncbi:hypothetical protein GCM10010269_57740 [Streptomyces humidus]|uniref:Uncharacterized protein n=1 Tax=Streptomyces humidus TaxID=52259 RepID=A0A918L5Q9_9ACTN|nr:hypothetical protein GCM10010269_57740 [Streptomyces humidus]
MAGLRLRRRPSRRGAVRERAGPGNVHIGRDPGGTPVVLDLLDVLPQGAPFSEDAPDPGCPFE